MECSVRQHLRDVLVLARLHIVQCHTVVGVVILQVPPQHLEVVSRDECFLVGACTQGTDRRLMGGDEGAQGLDDVVGEGLGGLVDDGVAVAPQAVELDEDVVGCEVEDGVGRHLGADGDDAGDFLVDALFGRVGAPVLLDGEGLVGEAAFEGCGSFTFEEGRRRRLVVYRFCFIVFVTIIVVLCSCW